MNSFRPVFLYLPRYSFYGGVEKFALNLANYLSQKNIPITFVCSRQEVKAPSSIKVIKLGRPSLPKSFKMFYFALKSLQITKAFPNALHFSLGKTFKQDLLRIGGGPLKIFWDLSKEAYPGLEKSFKMFRRKVAPSNWLTFFIEKQQLQTSKHIICVSDLVQQWLIRAYPNLNKSLEVIYNLPDLNKFSPSQDSLTFRKEFNLPLDKKIILTVATNFKLKGIYFLLKALKLLPKQFILVVAGNRNPKTYLRFAKKHNLEKRVFFLGKVEEINRLYSASDYFILNSFYDACSNALLEAMASGLKCLSSQFNGSSIFLPPAQIIQNPKDPLEIKEKLLKAKVIPLTYPSNLKYGFAAYYQTIRKFL